MSMRRTKLVATIGPASCARETLAQLLEAGVDVARLNFAHGTRAAHGRVMRDLRKIAARTGRAVAVLQDLAGPKIRTGPLAQGRVSLEPGQSFLLTPRDVPGDSTQVSVTYKNLAADVRAGDVLLLSDGALELSVDRISGGDLACRVVVGGKLLDGQGELTELSGAGEAFGVSPAATCQGGQDQPEKEADEHKHEQQFCAGKSRFSTHG